MDVLSFANFVPLESLGREDMGHSTMRAPTPERDRTRLAGQLRERSPELERDILAYFTEQASMDVGVAHLLRSLPAVIAAALDAWVSAIEHGHDWHVPTQVRSHARRAAVNGVDMPSSLRRSSHAATLVLQVLGDTLHAGSYSAATQRYAITTTSSVTNALVAAVAEGHAQELRRGMQTKAELVSELVRRLLNHEDVDTRELGYDLAANHICVIAAGKGVLKIIEITAERSGLARLVAPQDDGTIWAWFGSKSALQTSDVTRHILKSKSRMDTYIAISEPIRGIDGFRGAHWQANVTFSAALRDSAGPAMFADVADVVPFLQNPRAANALIALFLDPLRNNKADGDPLIATLAGYFACDCNASSACALLGVHRRTVEKHIRAAEERMKGRPLRVWRRQTELAMRIERLRVVGAHGGYCAELQVPSGARS
jgi:hypothetical protein